MKIFSSSGRTIPFRTKDRIFSTYLFDKASQSEPDEYNTKLLNNPMFRQMVAIEENHVILAIPS